jgi:hypothetical protein
MASSLWNASYGRLRRWAGRRKLRSQVRQLEERLAAQEREGAPVLFFDASTRLNHVSQNAAFSKLAEWAVRSKGVPTIRMVCHQGMSQCMLGTDRTDLEKPPPCRLCVRMSNILHAEERTIRLEFDPSVAQELSHRLADFSLSELENWTFRGFELGQLCLPSLRWALRRHHLPQEAGIRNLFRQYLSSAASLLSAFEVIMVAHAPRSLVVFNGISYPEGVAREVALSRDIPVVTHEVGLRPFSAFFSHGHATAYPIELPDRPLEPEEQVELNAYLQDRTQGQFSMAGVQFWPEIEPMPEALKGAISRHRGMVAVFTNVIFDTSQIHANVIFDDMFDWLKNLKGSILQNPETLFVIRAHPDEARPGKASQDDVAGWMLGSGLLSADNVVFIPPQEYISSYELIREAKLVLIYNSSIGLEASIMGAPVLSAGRARFTQVPTVFFPEDREGYMRMLEAFLAQGHVEAPPEFSENARRFLHYQLFRTSLSFGDFLGPDPDVQGGVLLKDFSPRDLDPEHCVEMDVIGKGIVEGEAFVYPRARSASEEMGAANS